MITGRGRLFVVSGPSGVGKDTLLEALRRELPDLRYSISATTRPRRDAEREGEHYFFLSRERFEDMRDRGGLLESKEYNGNLYGTPREYVERTLDGGGDLLVKPEVYGALAIKRAYPEAVLIFVTPDSFDSLRERLENRGTESWEDVERRLNIAREEMKFEKQFDYVVINRQGRFDDALKELQAIITTKPE